MTIQLGQNIRTNHTPTHILNAYVHIFYAERKRSATHQVRWNKRREV